MSVVVGVGRGGVKAVWVLMLVGEEVVGIGGVIAVVEGGVGRREGKGKLWVEVAGVGVCGGGGQVEVE